MNIFRRKVLKWAGAAPAVAALGAPLVGAGAQAVPSVRIGLLEAMSGPFANAGEAVHRNLAWAVERVNARGGVMMGGQARPLELRVFDTKGQAEEALSALRSALDNGISVVAQGNSSAVAAVLVDALEKHNEREPKRRALLLNYSAVDPALTNERCSFWHFRFDAHADMRLAALLQVLREDRSVQSVALIGQDYSFGHAVLREAKRLLALWRPDVRLALEELHPMGRIKDFAPYAAKLRASGAQAVITGNWGNDLSLLVRAAREAGYDGRFYTFYGNALGVPAAIGELGVGKVLAVADWLPNLGTPTSDRFYQSFRARFPRPADDYVHMRMQLMIEALAQGLERAGSAEATDLARALSQADVSLAGQRGRMRAADHQFQQALVVGEMDRVGAPGVRFDVEGSGFGFRVVRQVSAEQAQLPSSCKMRSPV